jgi:hypothetical protein
MVNASMIIVLVGVGQIHIIDLAGSFININIVNTVFSKNLLIALLIKGPEELSD